jgi:phosphoglycolate phosphatase
VLAVVSSNTHANVRGVLGPEIAALFKYYECGASIFGKKAKFHKILKHSGIPHYEAICIGDEIRDCEAARSENIAFGAVAWGYTRLEALQAHAPDEVFVRVDEIAEKIASRDMNE